MANWSIDGRTSEHDLALQRQAAGTVGDSAIVPKGVGGSRVSSVIDNQDASVSYITVDSNYLSNGTASNVNIQSGGYSPLLVKGTYAQLTKTSGAYSQAALTTIAGSAIGVLGIRQNANGTLRVYVDGVETPGRQPVYNRLSYTSYLSNSYQLNATDTTIYLDTLTGLSASNGYILIDGEVISYAAATVTGVDSNGLTVVGYASCGVLTGCTRGVYGAASSHNVSSTVYKWGTRFDLKSTLDYTSRQLLWYNPFLSQQTHSVMAVCTDDNSAGSNSYFLFDSFMRGGLIGQDSLNIEYGTITIASTDTGRGNSNINGYYDLGSIPSRSDVAIVGILGINQTNPSPNGGTMFKWGTTMSVAGALGMYLANGPASSAWNIQINVAYIAETL